MITRTTIYSAIICIKVNLHRMRRAARQRIVPHGAAASSQNGPHAPHGLIVFTEPHTLPSPFELPVPGIQKSTDFIVNCSSCFPFKGRTHRHTDPLTVKDATDHLITIVVQTAGVSNYICVRCLSFVGYAD